MTTIIIISILTVGALFILWKVRKRSATAVGLDTFVAAVKDAADVGERAYRAQVESIAELRSKAVEPHPRGVALARLLCALFPAAAFVALDAGNAVKPSVKKYAPFSGRDVWNVASGAALMPLNLADKPYFSQIREESNRATQAYAEFFSSHFTGDPIANVRAAETHLGPFWKEALELSLGQLDKSHHVTQFCTSGLQLFIDWFQALHK